MLTCWCFARSEDFGDFIRILLRIQLLVLLIKPARVFTAVADPPFVDW
jgi:hypothetical protein